MQGLTLKDRILGGLWGAVVGDALGVPVEFKSRATVQANPVTGMRGHGTHNQPPGTWSDDSSLLLCTMDSLLQHEFNTEDMGHRFVNWMRYGFWSANGDVFDVGLTTTDALLSIESGVMAEQAGSRDEYSNGNGSLMRILPVALRFAHEPTPVLLNYLARSSVITHGHERSQMACGFYGLVVKQLLLGSDPQSAFNSARAAFTDEYKNAADFERFARITTANLPGIPEGEIGSAGYVLDTLQASLWCLLTTHTFSECVLKAVNLGGDTDTTGCVTGGLAGVHYGVGSIPQEWRQALADHEKLETLFGQFVELVASKLEPA